ncbi:MAG: DUF4124 domain-containing protein [Dokdonella sp.]
MHRALTLAASLILPSGGMHVHAADAYRCSSANGVVFQDKPCRDDQTQKRIALPDDPAPPVTPASAPIDVGAPTPADSVQTVRTPPQIPMPSFFLCTRHDGKVYLSEDGVAGASAVPLGMLGVPGRSLADAYGGPNGIGISAPGVRPIPHFPASQAPLAGSYVWIEDTCHFAQPQEACAYLRNELDSVQSKLRRAFSDTQSQLEHDENSLRERLRGC